MVKLRPSQKEVYNYSSGKMGIVAVPGSGKTFTLSMLAAKLVAGDFLQDGQEVLIVTLTNSAVNNFKQSIAARLKELGLPPGLRYRVRTLHGIANDLLHERLDLAGLPNQFEIYAEREQERALNAIAQTWLVNHPQFRSQWQPTTPDESGHLESGGQTNWIDIIQSIAAAFIKQSKDLGLTPAAIRQRMTALHHPDPLLEMGCELFEEYQRSLGYAFAVDFQDLLSKALSILHADPEFLARMRYTWPYILEDEAQDSSALQEKILRTLVGENGNWVRVGDPNQAIYATFTTANPRFLRDFLYEPGVTPRSLPASGRSTRSIISLANYLMRWTREDHPAGELRDALTLPEIRPVDDPDDLQPNPEDNPRGVVLVEKLYTPDAELRAIAQSIKNWLPANSDKTVAVLTPSNPYGSRMVTELKNMKIPAVELLRSTAETRQVADQLWAVINYLAKPTESRRLRILYEKIYPIDNAPDPNLHHQIAELIQSCRRIEDYLNVNPGITPWLDSPAVQQAGPAARDELERFGNQVLRWQESAILPVDQIILTVAQELYTQPQDLAVAHRLALLLETIARARPDSTLSDYAAELHLVVTNQRKFNGLGDEDIGFNPELHRGKVVVTTMHKAKGLEWDRVYLASVNNYDFPSAQPYDVYYGEIDTNQEKVNLPSETLAKLNALVADDIPALNLPYGSATTEARLEHCAERLRLLYVGITRAKRELIITCNNGRHNNMRAALPFIALQEFWRKD